MTKPTKPTQAEPETDTQNEAAQAILDFGSAMTIHPVRMSGTVIAAPQTYSYFQRLQDRIVAFAAGHSHISAGDFQDLMLKKDDMAADVGSVIYGEEAVKLGLIDQVGGLSDGLQWLYGEIDGGKKKRKRKAT